MVVPPTDSGMAQNDRFMISDLLFANFLIIIHETKNLMRGFSKGYACTKLQVSVNKINVSSWFKIHFIKILLEMNT